MFSLFKSYLQSINVSPIKENDEMILTFEKGGLHFMFSCSTTDPYYFRVILPNVAQVSTDNRTTIMERINSSNSHFKVAKALIVNDHVWISAEQFVYSKNEQEDVFTLFKRIIILLEAFFNYFKQTAS